MTSTKIVAYATVPKTEFPDLEWVPIERIPDPERIPYYANYYYQAFIPTSDQRFLDMFHLVPDNSILTAEARQRVEQEMKAELARAGNCALLFSK